MDVFQAIQKSLADRRLCMADMVTDARYKKKEDFVFTENFDVDEFPFAFVNLANTFYTAILFRYANVSRFVVWDYLILINITFVGDTSGICTKNYR